ncbi:hypothetical protein NE237_016212 [Protea cynaroides]|uniref:Uncharacterized protein n=1 Tax=Protea cynaroides TaxID=273540 RepID=A0A9Q0KFS0_9MAGN|nr:hypothetical protein NE237_016212 [Protea cynaroides]
MGRESGIVFKEDQESQLAQPEEFDAGALFVLKSRGSWLHCGYHLMTVIVGLPVLSSPFTFAMLGWGVEIFCLTIGTSVLENSRFSLQELDISGLFRFCCFLRFNM